MIVSCFTTIAYTDANILSSLNFNPLAVPAFQVAYQAYTCACPFILFLEVLLEAHLLHPSVIFSDEWVHAPLILGKVADHIVAALKAASQLPLSCAPPVLTGGTSPLEATLTLGLAEPLESPTELAELEGLLSLLKPTVSSRVHEPFEFTRCEADSPVTARALPTVYAADTLGLLFTSPC